jgi:hypothetical protein
LDGEKYGSKPTHPIVKWPQAAMVSGLISGRRLVASVCHGAMAFSRFGPALFICVWRALQDVGQKFFNLSITFKITKSLSRKNFFWWFKDNQPAPSRCGLMKVALACHFHAQHAVARRGESPDRPGLCAAGIGRGARQVSGCRFEASRWAR